jgi:glycosidase
MKHFLCCLLLLSLLCGVCLSEAAYDSTGLYRLSGAGEAVIDDVVFSGVPSISDNNRVFYEIFVGSFSDSDGDGVGDLRGVINRMDYLNDGDPQSGLSLGIEGIWLTPIFASPSYHKYDVTDFYTIDPAFGTLEDLKELISLCHERDVKLILDLPINHTGIQNRWFRNFLNAHLMHNPENIYYDFYTWLTPGEPIPSGRHFAVVPGQDLLYEANFSDSMPELNFDNPLVRQTVLDVAKHYLALGVDGFRFDAAKYIYFGDHSRSAAFWDWYLDELKQGKPDLYAVAEVWDGDGVIDRYLPIMNCFHFSFSQVSGLIAETAKAGNVNQYTAAVQKYLEHLRALNPDAQGVLFVSNHDMDRAAGYLTAASGQMKMAANLYLLSPGSPFIYYGEEIGLRGSRGGANTDANRRLAMVWGDGDPIQDPEGATYAKQTPYSVKDLFRMGDSLYSYYKRLLMIRKANPEIARGEYKALSFSGTKAGGFVCTFEGSAVAVVHNTGDGTQKLDLADAPEVSGMEIAAVIGMGTATLENGVLTLEGQTSAVLR